jgi:hypothetical protein
MNYTANTMGIILILLYVIWLYYRATEIFTIVIYEVLAVTPIVALYLANGTTFLVLFATLSSDFIIYKVARLCSKRPIRLLPEKSVSLRFIFILSVLYLIIISKTLGFKFDFDLLMLKDIYVRRFEVEGRYNLLVLYTSSFVSKFLIPIILIRSIILKRYLLALSAVILFVLFFLTTSLKTVLFTPVVLLSLHFLRVKSRFSLESLLTAGLSVVLIIEYIYLDGALLARRLFYIPAVLNNNYFEFFSGNSQLLSYGWYNPFINYAYDLPPSRLIASVYWGDSGTSANNGLVSSGFMDFGILGVYAYSLLFGLILGQFPNNLQRDYAGVFVLLVFVFTTSFFITSLLSHGVLLFLLVNRFLLKSV